MIELYVANENCFGASYLPYTNVLYAEAGASIPSGVVPQFTRRLKPRQSRKAGYLYGGYLNDAEFRLLCSLQTRVERNGNPLFLLTWLVPNKPVGVLRA